MPIDLGRFIRMRAAIDATLAANERPSRAIVTKTDTFREQILVMLRVDSDLSAEFEALFPTPIAAPNPGSRRPATGSLILPADLQGPARLSLAGMSGWLAGLIESSQAAAQRQANAEAYAREKVRAERGVGFRAESPR